MKKEEDFLIFYKLMFCKKFKKNKKGIPSKWLPYSRKVVLVQTLMTILDMTKSPIYYYDFNGSGSIFISCNKVNLRNDEYITKIIEQVTNIIPDLEYNKRYENVTQEENIWGPHMNLIDRILIKRFLTTIEITKPNEFKYLDNCIKFRPVKPSTKNKNCARIALLNSEVFLKMGICLTV